MEDGACTVRTTTFNHVSIHWPDVATLDMSVVTEVRKLADDVPQNADVAGATLFPAG